MHHVRNIDELRARVRELKQKQDGDWKHIKHGVKDKYESLKPSNLIGRLVDNIPTSINPESDILEQGAGIASSLLVDSLLASSKNKPLKRWLTLVVFYGLTYVITRYREDIIDGGNKFLNYVSERLQAVKEKAKAKAEEKAKAED